MALKNYKPTSPGRRGLILVDKSALYKGKPVKSLVEKLTKLVKLMPFGHVPPRS